MPADEFGIIKSLFAPLATHAGARGLLDDVAVLETKGALVLTTDAIVEGVHFRPDDPIDTVAKKALRVNLSDLAAKGAAPIGALLTLIWPDQRPASQIADFARGLGEDLRHYDVALFGGDTTSTPGPLSVSITAFGEPLAARVPARADAKPGEDIWLTGAIGDAWLGYEALCGHWPTADAAHRDAVIACYRLPEPRTAFADIVARCAGAAMDVSDGLTGDAAKLASASGVALRIDTGCVPLSEAARAWMAQTDSFGRLLDWGDDYEILFTAAPARRAEIESGGVARGVRVTRIGVVEEGAGVKIATADGSLTVAGGGYTHKLGR
ncbi:MAG: thiamine-phosphate kinase [Terricaulis sp.]